MISQTEFDMLATELKRDTGLSSSLNKMTGHWAYEELRSKGRAAIPYILNSYDTEYYSASFLSLLNEITGLDPAKGEDTITGAWEKWEEWAEREGYI